MIALAAVAALILTALAFTSIVHWLIRQQARERNLLLNQVMHLSGRTWEPPPALPEPEPFVDNVYAFDQDPDLY